MEWGSDMRCLANAGRRGWILLAALAALFGSPALADTYDIDSEHTEVRFTWDHLGISRQGGRFTEVSGTLEFDPSRPADSKVAATIPLSSILTGNAKLDEVLLKSGEWFTPGTYPEIRFESTAVAVTSDKTADVTGTLTFNGVSKPVVLEVVWRFAGEHPLGTINPTFAGQYVAGFSATTQFRRSDWGLSRTIPFISDELQITIETELVRRPLPIPAATDDPALIALPPQGEAPVGEPNVPPTAPVRAEPLPPLPAEDHGLFPGAATTPVAPGEGSAPGFPPSSAADTGLGAPSALPEPR